MHGGRGGLRARPVAELWGRVVLEADEGFLYLANMAHHTANRVLQMGAEGDVETLDDVARLGR